MNPGYKETELGLIPSDWECVRIASVARLESGHTPSKRQPTYWGGRIPWVSLHDTDGLNSWEILTTAQMISEEGLKHSSARMLPKGTVVFSRTATVGKVTVLGRDMATSQDFANYVCGPRLYNYFLLYLFRGMGRTWKALMAGSIHNTIYMPVFKALQIVLPPLAEQRAIAEALSDVDALLGALDRLIAKKRDLKQATMQQLLTGKIRLPSFRPSIPKFKMTEVGEIPEEWKAPKIEAIIDEISMGPFGSDIKVSNFVTEGVPVLNGANVALERLTDMFENFVTLAKAKSLKKAVARRGDVVVTHRGTIGQVSYIPADSEFDSYVISQSQFRVRFSLDDVVPAWVALYFHSDIGSRKLLEGKAHTGVPAIAQPTKTFRNLSIPLPSLSEQAAIVEVLSGMDAELVGLESRRDKTHALKQGMMQDLLTGRTRLVS
jgi:type I restriction enzyme S subunit